MSGTYSPTLAQAKSFLRVEHDAEDTLISALLASAEDFVLDMTGAESIGTPTLQAAVLLSLAGLYEHRDGLIDGKAASRPQLHPVLETVLKSCRVDHSIT